MLSAKIILLNYANQVTLNNNFIIVSICIYCKQKNVLLLDYFIKYNLKTLNVWFFPWLYANLNVSSSVM